jgi:hypothetical protein
VVEHLPSKHKAEFKLQCHKREREKKQKPKKPAREMAEKNF